MSIETNHADGPVGTFEYAIWYSEMGLSVIAVPPRHKAAIVRWKQFQTDRPKAEQLKKWFGRDCQRGEKMLNGGEVISWPSGPANIAIVCGAASGGVAVRDFDIPGAYEKWAGENVELSRTLPTVKTSRGHHVYFRSSARVNLTKLEDGEVRGEGAYVVAPPSIHPSGCTYRWEVPISGSIPVISDDEFTTFFPSRELTISHPNSHSSAHCTEEDRRSTEEDRRAQKRTEAIYVSRGKDSNELTNSDANQSYLIGQAVLASLPTEEGQREKKLFELARRLLAIFPRNTPRLDLAVPFEKWWEEAQSVIATKEKEISMEAFFRCWEKANTPLEDPIPICIERAKESPMPEWTSILSTPECLLLGGVCRELQRLSGSEPFFIPCRSVERYMGVPYRTAATWLSLFVRLNVLEIVEKHTTKLGSRYRYIHGDL